jgi:hypothetical protein
MHHPWRIVDIACLGVNQSGVSAKSVSEAVVRTLPFHSFFHSIPPNFACDYLLKLFSFLNGVKTTNSIHFQCLSNTRALTVYFLKELHQKELNQNNPDSLNGLLALR